MLVELHHHIGDTRWRRSATPVVCRRSASTSSLYCSGQMFREMQAALLFARGKEIRNNALRGNSPFKSFRCARARRWSGRPIGGARAFLMEDKIGTLSPGKKADIVMLRANDINMAPVYDPVYSIVEIAGAGNVDTVIIDGVVRKQNGKLTFPADVLRPRLDELAESGARIMREAGYRVASAPQ